MIETLGDVLSRIHDFPFAYNGVHTLFLPCDLDTYQADTPCAVLFLTGEQARQADFQHPSAIAHNLCQVADVPMVKEIVDAAREYKPNCTKEDLVKALNFYLERDAFYPFDDEGK